MNSKDDIDYIDERKRYLPFGILIGAAAVVVVLVCMVFVFMVGRITSRETERYFKEITTSISYSINAQLNDNINELRSIAHTYTYIQHETPASMQFLQEKAEIANFTRVALVMPDGSAIASDGADIHYDPDSRIMDAFKGTAVICNTGLQSNGITYAVPIYTNGRVNRILTASNTTEWIDSLLDKQYFNGEAFFHIFEKSGDYVIVSHNRYVSLATADNIYEAFSSRDMTLENNSSVEQFKKNVDRGETGFMYYKPFDGKHRILYYTPLEHSDFYLSMIVMKRAATKNFDRLSLISLTINAFIALMFVGLVIVITTINRKHSQTMYRVAYYDPVTGGINKQRFRIEALKLLGSKPAGYYSFVSVNMVRFKLINDTYGAEDGDRVLRHIFHTINSSLHDDEVMARRESDNFDILMRTDTNSGMIKRLGKICEEINAFNKTSEIKYYLHLNMGVYKITDPNTSIISMRGYANIARKNNVGAYDDPYLSCVFYTEGEKEKMLREKDMENHMNTALANHEFSVYLQPKYSLARNEIVSAEALVRWDSPELGRISPLDFIGFFEQNGFIIKLDLYVFEQVCKTLRKWIDCGKTPVSVSVNLSKRHMDFPGFMEKYKAVQEKYSIPPELIEIELTESLVFDNLEIVMQTIATIHEYGFKCSLDDFGSGYSSLNILKDLNVDILKIDKEFFRPDSTANANEHAIIETIVHMAKKLGMTVVSEGVETDEQLDFLRSVECDMVQGYIISRPVPTEQFEQLLFHEIVHENDKH